MNWLALFAALANLAGTIASALRDRSLIATGEARGRAASDRAHARAAAAQDERMREIAAKPPTRADADKRLEEGSA